MEERATIQLRCPNCRIGILFFRDFIHQTRKFYFDCVQCGYRELIDVDQRPELKTEIDGQTER